MPMTLENFHTQSIGVLAVVPFLVYTTICFFFTYVYATSSATCWIVVFLSLCMSCVCLTLSSKRQDAPMFYVFLGVLAFLATVFGACFGHLNWSQSMSYSEHYDGQRTYNNVLPTEAALSHLDAGKIVFSGDSKLDLSKSMGYKDGSMYCLAPIVSGTAKKIEYFAAGVDCCQAKGGFECNDYDDKKAHSGLVYLKFGDQDKLNNFRQAAKKYADDQGVNVSQDALFVKWVENADDAAGSYSTSGLVFFIVTSIIYLVISVMAAVGIHYSQRKENAASSHGSVAPLIPK